MQIEFTQLLNEIDQYYKNNNDANLYFILRIKSIFNLLQNPLFDSLQYFTYLNNHLTRLERQKKISYKINNSELNNYYEFYKTFNNLPNLTISYNSEQEIIDLLNSDKFNQISKRNQTIQINKYDIITNQTVGDIILFNLKYFKYMKNIILLLLQTKKHCLTRINLCNHMKKNKQMNLLLNAYNIYLSSTEDYITAFYNIIKYIMNQID